MKYTRTKIIAASAVAVMGAAGIGASAMAASNSSGSTYPPIVQKLASTFGLDPAKVDNVFKQQHQDNMQDRQAKLKSTLDQAVKDGKLTQDQETRLIAEFKTLHDQSKTNRQDFKTQLDQWAKDNGITNLDQILPTPPAGMHQRMPDNDGDADDN